LNRDAIEGKMKRMLLVARGVPFYAAAMTLRSSHLVPNILEFTIPISKEGDGYKYGAADALSS
jgi:hypothetical protein